MDVGYTRNRIRQELIPALARDYNPRVVEALARLGQRAREAQEVIMAKASELLARLRPVASEGRLKLDCESLANEGSCLIREALILAWELAGLPQGEMGAEEWDKLAQLAIERLPAQETRLLELPGNIRATRRGPSVEVHSAASDPPAARRKPSDYDT